MDVGLTTELPVHIAGHLILFGQPRSNTRQMVLCQAVDALRG